MLLSTFKLVPLSFILILSSSSFGLTIPSFNISDNFENNFYFTKFNVSATCTIQRLQYIDVSQNIFAWLFLHYDDCLALGKNDGVNFQGKFCKARITIPGKRAIENMDIPLFEEIILNSIATTAVKLSYENPMAYFLENFFHDRNVDIFENNIKLPLKMCYPDGCSVDDIRNILNIDFNTVFNEEIFHIDLQESDCEVKKSIHFTWIDWTVMGYFFFFGVIVTICTSYDIYCKYFEKDIKNPKLVAFSWYTNFKRLVKIKNIPEQFDSVDGIRCLSLSWIILGHVYLDYGAFVQEINIASTMNFSDDYSNMFILSANFAVESYFFISGFLLMYGFLKYYTKTKKFNIWMFYLNRYLRLTFPLLGVVGFYASIMPYLGSGPNWNSKASVLKQDCQSYWWTSLLYIQNYINPTNICIGQTWYLQVDTQLYFFSPIIILSLVWFPRVGKIFLGVLAGLGVILPIVIFYKYDLRLDPLITMPPLNNKFREYYYQATYARAGSWIFGLIFGYFMFHNKTKKYINNVVVFVFWVASIASICGVTIAHQPFLNGANDFGCLIPGFYFAFSSVIWCIVIGWIIYATRYGYGGPITYILSLKMWKILTRCSYSIFLIHFIVIFFRFATMQTPVYYNFFDMFGSFCACTIISILISIPWALTFEMPLSVLLNKTKRDDDVRSNDLNETAANEYNFQKLVPNILLFKKANTDQDIAIVGQYSIGKFNTANLD